MHRIDLMLILKIFIFCSFLSIAAGNIFLGITTLIFIKQAVKNKVSFNELFAKYDGYRKAIGIFLIAIFLSAIFSGDILYGLKRWVDMWIWRMMPLVMTLCAVRHRSDAIELLQVSIVGFAVSCCCAIYQGLNGDLRAAGFFGNPMTFAGWLCIFVPLLFLEAIENKIFNNKKYLSIFIFIVSFLALYYNGTRGAWLAVAIILGMLMIYYAVRNKKALVVSVSVILMLSIAVSTNDYFVKRVSSININHSSNQERFLMWSSAWDMFKDNPLLGVGLGQYKDQYQNIYVSPLAKEPKLEHAHNNIMQMLAENGIIGTLGFLIMVGYIILNNLVNWFKSKEIFSLMIVASTTALLLQGLTEYNFGNSAIVKVYWFILGCLLVITCKKSDVSDRDV